MPKVQEPQRLLRMDRTSRWKLMHWQLVNLQVWPRKWAKLDGWRQKSSRRRCTQCASAALLQRDRPLMATGLQTAVSRQGQANSSTATSNLSRPVSPAMCHAAAQRHTTKQQPARCCTTAAHTPAHAPGPAPLGSRYAGSFGLRRSGTRLQPHCHPHAAPPRCSGRERQCRGGLAWRADALRS